MTSYELDLEVAGGLGPGTRWGSRPNEITRLGYEFDGWLGDDLVTSVPVTIATTCVRDAITAAGLTGVEFADVLVTRSGEFDDVMGADAELPEWVWLRPVGVPGRDDAWAGRWNRLTVSQRMYTLMQQFHLNHCIVTPVAD
jgi:uncharacterized repeat protein (TIGR02543 family)